MDGLFRDDYRKTEIEKRLEETSVEPVVLEDVDVNDDFEAHTNTMVIGLGQKSIRMNRQGIWMGSVTPENAPFFVSPEGKIVVKSTAPNGGFIEIDGANARILVHDGTTYRVLISAQD